MRQYFYQSFVISRLWQVNSALPLSVSNIYCNERWLFADYVSAKPMLHMEPSGRRTVLSIFATVINVNNEVSAFVVNKCCYTYNIELCVSGFCTQSISAYRIFWSPHTGVGVRLWCYNCSLSAKLCSIFTNINRRVTEAGFLLICLGFVFIDERTSTPGVSTLLPVLGTTLILIGGNEKGVINSILKQKLMVFIGLISYSLYVWHQPLFSLFSDLNNASLLLVHSFYQYYLGSLLKSHFGHLKLKEE